MQPSLLPEMVAWHAQRCMKVDRVMAPHVRHQPLTYAIVVTLATAVLVAKTIGTVAEVISFVRIVFAGFHIRCAGLPSLTNDNQCFVLCFLYLCFFIERTMYVHRHQLGTAIVAFAHGALNA